MTRRKCETVHDWRDGIDRGSCEDVAGWAILPNACHPAAEIRYACYRHVVDFVHIGSDCSGSIVRGMTQKESKGTS